ncbi:MAG: FIST C-terminal domain-containing protein [Bdellovibrio sp.]|nr:FIST C-terminal domain-containing protein [Methylotenera sp.]
MKVATGLAIGKSALPALAAQAVTMAMQKAGITQPSSVLLFLTSEFAADPQSAIKAAAKAASCTQIIGCSATGIFTEEDWVIDSPAAAAMVFTELDFNRPKLDGADDQLLLTLTAPNAINTTWLNKSGLNKSALNEAEYNNAGQPHFGLNGFARFGGVSGDAIGHGPFSVWQNGKGTTQGYCEVALNHINMAVAASHGLKMISSPRKITAVQGNDLLSVANLPALTTLTNAWQKHAKTSSSPPYHQLMAVYASKASMLERGEYNLASIIIENVSEGSVTLTKSLPVGDWLSWAVRDIDAAQVDIVKTAGELKQQLGTEPAFALLFSCLGRGPYFYNGSDQDLALLKTLFPKLPIIGFYGNGEIAPMNGRNELLQYSAVLGLFAESNVISL